MAANHTPDDDAEVNASRNDATTYGDDTLGENTGDSALDIEANDPEKVKPDAKQVQEKDPRIETVIPDNDN